jgi:flagellar hook assembly protein FlgD
MKRAAFFVLLALAGLPVRAATTVSGDIPTSTTWTLANSPYILTGHVRVGGVTTPAVLTIEAGVEVRVNTTNELSVNVNGLKGALVVNGTAQLPVLFTFNAATPPSPDPPLPGSWFGLRFGSTADAPQSTIRWATIEYAGWVNARRGGVHVEGGSPLLEHVTLRRNAYAGMTSGGAPTIRDSTVTSNAGPGLSAWAGAGLTMSTVTFTSNSGCAVSMSGNVPVLGAGNLTAAGNTEGDGICFPQGGVSESSSWARSNLPYILSGTFAIGGSHAPVLTIAAGVTIKFNGGGQLFVNNPGALQAVGTAAEPIVFTSNGAPIKGAWNGIYLGSEASEPTTKIAYATIENAGSNFFTRGGISVINGSPEFDHLTIRNNQRAGMVVRTARPRITNSHFSDNDRGIDADGNGSTQATLNYWDSAEGPCLSGCTGGRQSATASVVYEPWLVAAPSGALFLASAFHRNTVFNPSIGTRTWLDYTASFPGSVAMTIRNSSNVLVRTLTVSGTPGTLTWDGMNASGAVQPNGDYRYEVAATAPSQPPAVIAQGLVTIDHARALTLSNPAASQAFFSPNGDTIKDTTTVSAATNYDDTTWILRVLDPSGNAVRTEKSEGRSIAFAWNGQNDQAVVQADAPYTVSVKASVGTQSLPQSASITKTATTTLDNTVPIAALTTPATGAVLSNVYANGSTLVTPTGRASDLNLLDWSLRTGPPAAPTAWTLGSGTTSISTTGPLVSTAWNTATVSNGGYTLTLTVQDKAGNVVTRARPVTLGNFSATQDNVYEFNPSNGQTLRYISSVPFPVTESIVIKNVNGGIVRSLVTAVERNAGNFDDLFDGRNDAGALLPDGPYFYVATIAAGTSVMTWDQSNVMRTQGPEFNDHLGIQPYDPLNNKPLTFNYDFVGPGRITVAMTSAITLGGAVQGDCANPGNDFFCAEVDVWEDSGPQTFTWWGLDHTGSYRMIRSLAIQSRRNRFAVNAAVLYGTKPKVGNVRVTPPVFGPEVDPPQKISFDLTTYQNQPVNLTIELVNLASKQTIRTLYRRGQPAGAGVLEWDGRSANGMLAASGRYSVVVSVTDATGNVVQSGILTEIQY